MNWVKWQKVHAPPKKPNLHSELKNYLGQMQRTSASAEAVSASVSSRRTCLQARPDSPRRTHSDLDCRKTLVRRPSIPHTLQHNSQRGLID